LHRGRYVATGVCRSPKSLHNFGYFGGGVARGFGEERDLVGITQRDLLKSASVSSSDVHHTRHYARIPRIVGRADDWSLCVV